MEKLKSFHRLKTWPEYFEKVASGEKTFEIRKNERDFVVGDILVLEEFNPDLLLYTGRVIKKEVTYILSDPTFVKEGFIIMAMV